jgi:hypothetical protein
MKRPLVLENLYNKVAEAGAASSKSSRYLHIDLYTMESSMLDANEVKDAIEGLELVQGAKKVWKAEEYIVIEL